MIFCPGLFLTSFSFLNMQRDDDDEGDALTLVGRPRPSVRPFSAGGNSGAAFNGAQILR